jgi:hypothetical protein
MRLQQRPTERHAGSPTHIKLIFGSAPPLRYPGGHCTAE